RKQIVTINREQSQISSKKLRKSTYNVTESYLNIHKYPFYLIADKMSTHKEYALIAILATAAVVGVVPAFADNPYLACPDCNETSSNIQSPPIPITVTTDKSVYDHNSVIIVNGYVKNPYPGQDVAMKVISPSGNVVAADQLSHDSNGDFSTKINTASPLMFENWQFN